MFFETGSCYGVAKSPRMHARTHEFTTVRYKGPFCSSYTSPTHACMHASPLYIASLAGTRRTPTCSPSAISTLSALPQLSPLDLYVASLAGTRRMPTCSPSTISTLARPSFGTASAQRTRPSLSAWHRGCSRSCTRHATRSSVTRCGPILWET